ncbi:MAG TPA: zinc ribbon domain-containing protein [Gemmatimonadales bacterium]|nr:zinc ribbon domain-containing protein [Gemmatimonadales bacterium]
MPTYEYLCPQGHTFELFQRISDPPRAKCPTCGKRSERVISGGAGLIFKGSGFYITDYGKDGKGPRKESSGESGGSTSSAEPKKESDTKSDAAPKPEIKPKKKAEP